MVINTNLLWMIGGTLAALSVGSAIRLIALRRSPADVVKQRLGSLKVWWLLALLWSVAAVIGLWGVSVLLAVASFLALREYLRLLGTTAQIGRAAIVGLIALGGLHYGAIAGGASQTAKLFFPMVALIVVVGLRLANKRTDDYIRLTAGLYWGAMLMIYGLSHALFLFEVHSGDEPIVGAAGWVLFLVLLTEMNDIMQALVGRKIGRRKLAPRVSPHKTWKV